MSQQIGELLHTIEVTAPQQSGNLQVFGLRWANDNTLNYVTLDDSLATGLLEVTEVNEGGSVPILKVVNKGDTMVFLMAGEQLIGAKQNRVLNASIMVPRQTELPIPVSCVEAGRWRYRSQKFASSDTMSHSMLRKKMSHHTLEGYRTQGTPSSRQTEVWGEITRKMETMKSCSPSQELNQVYEDNRLRLAEFLNQLQAPADCSGVAFVLNGKVAGLDMFDRPATLSKLWPKLVHSYALDALEMKDQPPASLTPEAVRDWLRQAEHAKAEPYRSPGVGSDIRLEGDTLVGAGLVVEGHPVHVELFTRDE